MVLSNHPYVSDLDDRACGYMGNTYIVREGGGEVLSTHPLGIFSIG